MAKVLIFKDECNLSNLIWSELEGEGHQIVQASEGPFGPDGLEVCRQLR